MSYFLQIILNGVHSGALYALLSYGYVLAYLVTKRANVAHGALFAFSGQIFTLGTSFAYNTLWIILPLSIALGGLIALVVSTIVLIILARKVFPTLIKRAPNTMIATSLAISIVLMESARIISGGHDYWLTPVLATRVPLEIGTVSAALTLIQIINIFVIAALLVLAQITLNGTMVGRRIRAISDDPLSASLCGIDIARTTTFAIVTGGLFAVIGGIIAVIYYGNMSFGAGLTYGLKILFIASAGGFSRPLYAAIGAFAFGISESLWDGYFPILWREAIFYALLALVLCLRTEGQININDRI